METHHTLAEYQARAPQALGVPSACAAYPGNSIASATKLDAIQNLLRAVEIAHQQ